MSRPKKVVESQADYPTLSQFRRERRRVLKGAASGALYLGLGGSLVACLGGPDGAGGSGSSDGGSANIDAGVFRNPDAGNDTTIVHTTDAGRDHGRYTTPDRGQDTAEEVSEVGTGPEMEIAGGMPEPEYEQVRLPSEGHTEVYLPSNDYVAFAVTFVTYDYSFGQYFRDNEEVGLNACVQVLCSYSADDLNDDAIRSDVELELARALNAAYEASVGTYYSGAEAVDLHIEDSYSYHEIDGDIAEPSFPFTCE